MIQERGKNNSGERKDVAGWCLWISKRWDLLQKPRTSQIANIHWIIEKAREFQKNICFCFIDYVKAFDCVDHNKLWKILKEMGIPDRLTVSWETYMQAKKQQLEPDMEQWTGFKSGKVYIKAIYCHPA